jgi:hypothetical protein
VGRKRGIVRCSLYVILVSCTVRQCGVVMANPREIISQRSPNPSPNCPAINNPVTYFYCKTVLKSPHEMYECCCSQPIVVALVAVLMKKHCDVVFVLHFY